MPPGAEFRPSPTCWTQWQSPLTVISGVEWGLNEPTWGFSGKIEQKSDLTSQVWFSQTRTNFWYPKGVASAKLAKFFRSDTKLRIRATMEWVGCDFGSNLACFFAVLLQITQSVYEHRGAPCRDVSHWKEHKKWLNKSGVSSLGTFRKN